ncbi:MAG TPA: hypothetical protein VG937_29730 [Polyangiaceae bacterium]|nr:hypothetical protein [Polyangiaceae bacterium]
MTPATLARILRAAADECDRLDSEARTERRSWVDQSSSDLGRKRHPAAVRRRLARGEAGAAVVGRRFLLSPEALSEELARLTSRPKPVRKLSVAAELRAELGLVGGAR